MLEQRPGVADVVVVGGGYCGIELATTVAERMQGSGRVQLITGGSLSVALQLNCTEVPIMFFPAGDWVACAASQCQVKGLDLDPILCITLGGSLG